MYAGAEELFAISTQCAINYVLILGTHEHISHAVCKPCRRGWGLIPVVVSRLVVQDVLSCGERGRARDGADPYDSSRHDSQSHRTSNATAFSIQKGAWTYATAFQLKVPSITRPGSADGPQRDARASRAVWTMQAGHAKGAADRARDPGAPARTTAG